MGDSSHAGSPVAWEGPGAFDQDRVEPITSVMSPPNPPGPLQVGTSEHGQVVAAENLALPAFKHLLIAFGGPLGLEDALGQDKKLKGREPTEVFDLYINTCANQGSRTIRTEEAVLISMTFIQSAVQKFGKQR